MLETVSRPWKGTDSHLGDGGLPRTRDPAVCPQGLLAGQGNLPGEGRRLCGDLVRSWLQKGGDGRQDMGSTQGRADSRSLPGKIGDCNRSVQERDPRLSCAV